MLEALLEGDKLLPVCPKHHARLSPAVDHGVFDVHGEERLYFVCRCPICKQKVRYYTDIGITQRYTLNPTTEVQLMLPGLDQRADGDALISPAQQKGRGHRVATW